MRGVSRDARDHLRREKGALRTIEEERARYNWLTPGQFAEEVGVSEEYIRSLIRDGELGGGGDVMDVGRRGRRMYRLHPRTLEKFRRDSIERAAAERAG